MFKNILHSSKILENIKGYITYKKYYAFMRKLSAWLALCNDSQQHPSLAFLEPKNRKVRPIFQDLLSWPFYWTCFTSLSLILPSWLILLVFISVEWGLCVKRQLMLYRGCLRCRRVINLVALFPINYLTTRPTTESADQYAIAPI